MEKGDTFLKLLYCYILFLDERGKKKPFRSLDHVSMNLSTTDKFAYDVETNMLMRYNRDSPLPSHFWSDADTKPEDCNIYNINVISGQNGSGKTTAIRCVMNLLDFFHAAVDKAVDKSKWKAPLEITRSRALLLLEIEGIPYLLDYAPSVWKVNNEFKTTGFSDTLHVVSCHSWKALAVKNDCNEIVSSLLKTKIVYLTNTLTQYDYERHLEEPNERLRDNFIYDASIGANISPGIAQFFPYEVYKQVKFIFDAKQAEKKDQETHLKLINNESIFKIPNTLRLRLRLEQYVKAFSRNYFPTIAAKVDTGNRRVRIPPNDLNLSTLLGILCVAAFADIVGQQINEKYNSMMNKHSRQTTIHSSELKELDTMIQDLENDFYLSTGNNSVMECKEVIKCLVSFPDGRIICGSGNKIWVWDTTTRDRPRCLEEHKGQINCMAILPDGNVISGSDDYTLRIWNLATNQSRILGKHTSVIWCIAVLPNRRIVSGSSDSTLQVWDIDKGQYMPPLRGHTGGIRCLAVLQDGRVVSGSDDHTLCVWDTSKGSCLKTLKGHTGSIRCVVVHPKGWIISGSDDATLIIWNANTYEKLKPLCEHTSRVTCLAIFPDGRVISGSSDGTLRIWDIEKCECVMVLGKKTDNLAEEVRCICIISDDLVISGSRDGTLKLWDAKKGKRPETVQGHADWINCIDVSTNGFIISGSMDGYVKLWRIGENKRTLEPHPSELSKNCRDYLKYLFDEKYKALFSRFTRINENTFELSLQSITKDKDQETEAIEQEFIEFIQKYKHTCNSAYTIDFDWGMSSGEENILRIFSNLYHVFDQTSNRNNRIIYNNEAHIKEYNGRTECDTVLLFMDEADLTFHPEWQRCLIENLTTYIPRIYPASCAKDIQLILSTHSPLILGDIPGENITYLFAKDTQSQKSKSVQAIPGETFGQNIHTILQENFFLGKGTVGSFAARKINDLADQLFALKEQAINNPEGVSSILSQLPKIRQKINLVAPGVLRTQLEILLRDVEDRMRHQEQEETEQMLKAWRALPPEKRLNMLKSIKQESSHHD